MDGSDAAKQIRPPGPSRVTASQAIGPGFSTAGLGLLFLDFFLRLAASASPHSETARIKAMKKLKVRLDDNPLWLRLPAGSCV